MNLPFFKYSPSGNMTLLVHMDNQAGGAAQPAQCCPASRRDISNLTRRERAIVAAEIIAPNHLAAEQAGFICLETDPPRLDMMGGEFCINATRALAALLLEQGKLFRKKESNNPDQEWSVGMVRVSGIQTPLKVRARYTGGQVEAAVCLNRKILPAVVSAGLGMHLVRVPGISHLVLDANVHPLPDSWKENVRELLAKYDLLQEEAAGCVWLRPAPAHARPDAAVEKKKDVVLPDCWSLVPFVHVRDTGTICAESSCGSGTLAAALVASATDTAPSVRMFMQPSGESLSVSLDADTAWIGGMVRPIARGEVFVHSLDPETEGGM